MENTNKYDRSSEGTLSLEEVLVKHFFYSLDTFRSSWHGESGTLNKTQFNLDLLYLIRLLPKKSKQDEILAKWAAAQESMQDIKGVSKDEMIAFVGMEVVTEIVLFICDAFELINEDITGPATSKQYQDQAIEIPDMPVDYGVRTPH